jgi:hypothetical protein
LLLEKAEKEATEQKHYIDILEHYITDELKAKLPAKEAIKKEKLRIHTEVEHEHHHEHLLT